MNWDLAVVARHLPFLLAGVRMTVLVTAASMAGGLVAGLLVALLRMSRFRPLQAAAGLYIDFWRSTPLLAQLIWVFYALPILTGLSLPPFLAGVLTLSLHASAYLAEIYRADRKSVV